MEWKQPTKGNTEKEASNEAMMDYKSNRKEKAAYSVLKNNQTKHKREE